MRPDYAIAADLCESHGLVEPARLLHQVADGSGELFLVRLDELVESFGMIPDLASEIPASVSRLFPTRAAAAVHAADLKLRVLRLLIRRVGALESLLTVSDEEFCRRMGAILGIHYQHSSYRLAPIVPSWASEEQLRAIAPLFHDRLVRVVPILLNPAPEA